MNKMQKFLLLMSLSMYGFPSMAQAPVVDAGENFAITSEPNEQPLAHDDTHQNSYFSGPSNGVSDNSNEIGKLLNQIHDLQQNVQELRGQLDNQSHTIETLKNQQLSLYKDLDDRIRQLNGAAANPANKMPDLSTAPKPSISNNPADEQISYMAAYKFVERKDFSKAETALQTFVEKYPQSGYTPNAEYWLGELYMQQKNYASAMAHFENVVNNFPSSNKHAACLYKLGMALAANGQADEAKNRLQAVIQKYPDSDTAKLAENQLHKL
jgi:tol-pal system protein YbgF